MTQINLSEIKEEIRNRIRRRGNRALYGSSSSYAKAKARAAELSDLLGWLKNKEKPVVSDSDQLPLGL